GACRAVKGKKGGVRFGGLDWRGGKMRCLALPLTQLREYRTDPAEPPDLALWWRRRLDQAGGAARPPALTRYQADTYAPVEVFDTEFSGAGGDRGRAWYLRPGGGGSPAAVGG